MENKVTWKREEGGTAVPYMFEEKNGRWAWYRFNNSKVHAPSDFGSVGYKSFLMALKAGYKAVEWEA